MYKNKFLSSVTVIDTETTNLYPEDAEIVEIAGATYDGNNWTVSAKLLGAVNGIPPEASAKTRISSRMIAGLPTFAESLDSVASILRPAESKFLVAHNCSYDQQVLAKAWNEAGESKLEAIACDRKNWICTYRLARQLIDFDFANMQYNLSYLRYRLDLPVDDNTVEHRAGDDTLVCAILFEFLVDYALAMGHITDESDIADQVYELCWQPMVYSKWPFGKNKGKDLSEIPDDYYVWALQNLDALNEDKKDYDFDLAESVRQELERRLES